MTTTTKGHQTKLPTKKPTLSEKVAILNKELIEARVQGGVNFARAVSAEDKLKKADVKALTMWVQRDVIAMVITAMIAGALIGFMIGALR